MINPSHSNSILNLDSLRKITSFLDIEQEYLSTVEKEIIESFGLTLIKTAKDNNGDSLNFLRTLQAMTMTFLEETSKEVSDNQKRQDLFNRVLQEENFGGNSKRRELVEIIYGLLGESDSSTSSYESVNNFREKLSECDLTGKKILRDFTKRFLVDLVMVNYPLLSDEKKSHWIEQVGKEADTLYADFIEKDQEKRAKLAQEVAQIEEAKESTNSNKRKDRDVEEDINGISQNYDKKVRTDSKTSEIKAISCLGLNTTMIFPNSSNNFNLEQEIVESLSIANNSPSSSPSCDNYSQLISARSTKNLGNLEIKRSSSR